MRRRERVGWNFETTQLNLEGGWLRDRFLTRVGLVRRYTAIMFDVDGTLAETEELHRRAFNEAFAFFDLGWTWDVTTYRKLLRVAGGKERIRHFLESHGKSHARFSDGDIAELHRFKTARFRTLVLEGYCDLRPGVAEFIGTARDRGQRLAIVTTTSRENVDALLTAKIGRSWMRYFNAVVAGDEVERKKPASDAYLRGLDLLGLPGRDCLAVEDSRNGLVAARGAGIPVLITRSIYFSDDNFSEAQAVVDDLSELRGFELYSR